MPKRRAGSSPQRLHGRRNSNDEFLLPGPQEESPLSFVIFVCLVVNHKVHEDAQNKNGGFRDPSPQGAEQSQMGASPLFLSPMGRGGGPLRSNGKVRAAA